MPSCAAVTAGGLVAVGIRAPLHALLIKRTRLTFLRKFALIPIFEPSNQQEAYDMVFDAFDLSESLGTPVMLRITTRLAHSRSGVTSREVRPQNTMHFSTNPRQFVLLPVNARVNYQALLDKQPAFLSNPRSRLKTNSYPVRTVAVIHRLRHCFQLLMENCDGCPYRVENWAVPASRGAD